MRQDLSVAARRLALPRAACRARKSGEVHADARPNDDAAMCVARGRTSCWAVMDRSSSAEGGVRGAAFGDLRLQAVAQCQQLLLVDDVLAAVLEVVFVDVRLHDRV